MRLLAAAGAIFLLLTILHSSPARKVPAAAGSATAAATARLHPNNHRPQHHHPRGSSSSVLAWARRQLAEQQQRWGGLRDSSFFGDLDAGDSTHWNRTDARRTTQGSAYASSDGPDEDDDPGFPFTAYTAEPNSLSEPSAVYFHEDGDQSLALDPQLGVWGGAWAGHKLNKNNRFKYRPTFKRQNPQRLGNTEDGDADNTTTISHFTLEAGDQRGMQALAGTYEGARAAAGSNTAFNLATTDSIVGQSSRTNDNASYGPTPGRPTVVREGERRSVAFTDLPPNSAAAAGTGYGVVAASAGYEVAANARSGTAPEVQASLGSRAPGDNGVFDAVEKPKKGRLHRKLQQQKQRKDGTAQPAAAAAWPAQSHLGLLGTPRDGSPIGSWRWVHVLLRWLQLPREA